MVSINCAHLSNKPLLAELVNEQILEGQLNNTLKVYHQAAEPTHTIINFSKDEENIIRYACGYVARKLMQKFMKQKGEKAAVFVECLSKMRSGHEDSGSLTSFFDYTCEWVKIVNRGGLYEVYDDAYLLIKEVETTMQTELIPLV